MPENGADSKAPMSIDIMTLFPALMDTITSESIIGRAQTAGILDIKSHNIRDYSQRAHRHVDDSPYGGGMGMLIAADVVYECYKDIAARRGDGHVIYMSPQGETLTQKTCERLAEKEHIIILCGHYEGVDQRVLDKIVDEEISVGDYVLTGGELACAVLVDAVCRLVPGVLSDSECHMKESISSGLLEYPQYTRPPVFEGEGVPEILLSGHHANIEVWRLEKSLEKTKKVRPDLYEAYIKRTDLSKSEIKVINGFEKKGG